MRLPIFLHGRSRAAHLTRRVGTTADVAALRNRPGFTLVEVVVASVILTSALLAMAGFTIRYQQTDSTARNFSKAQELSGARLETVRSAVPYASLDTMARTESTIPGYPGYTRVTQVVRSGGGMTDTVDFRTVTIRVSTPGNRQSVVKTSIMAAF